MTDPVREVALTHEAGLIDAGRLAIQEGGAGFTQRRNAGIAAQAQKRQPGGVRGQWHRAEKGGQQDKKPGTTPGDH